MAWAAANYVCAKRLVPFLPELVPSLERHGHLTVSAEVRTQLLTLSAATADRLLRPVRERTRPRGIGTTTAGTLLKHKVPIRTFAEWNDVRPGFMEVDTVAHCGTRAEGPYLSSLVLTDVATGWTECLALLHHGYDDVLRRARPGAGSASPSRCWAWTPTMGVSSSTTPCWSTARGRRSPSRGGGPIARTTSATWSRRTAPSCGRSWATTASRASWPTSQLAELYRALRLYVNVFQPSLKLVLKRREGSQVYRRYDGAQTPLPAPARGGRPR